MGGHLSNFKEISNELFTCPMNYSKKLTDKSKSYFIAEPYLSLNSTCTEEEFFDNVTPDMVHGGFLPRWIFVYSDRQPYRKRENLPEDINDRKQVFKEAISSFYDFFSTHEVVFKLTPDALESYDKICKDLYENSAWNDVQPFVKRYENYIISYADILCFNDLYTKYTQYTHYTTYTNNTINTTNTSDISQMFVGLVVNSVYSVNVVNDYIQKAWNLLRPCLEYSRKIVKYVDEDVVIRKLASVLEKHAPIKRSDAMHRSHLDRCKFGLALTTLTEREEYSIDTTTKIISKVGE